MSFKSFELGVRMEIWWLISIYPIHLSPGDCWAFGGAYIAIDSTRMTLDPANTGRGKVHEMRLPVTPF